jgi:hypothetical protein
MKFLFISPNFPHIYSNFVKALRERGVTVLGIGDCPYEHLNYDLKNNLTEYCYVSDMTRLDWMKNTVDYLRNKYGRIDFVESNNEFWLNTDAELRRHLNTDTGFWPEDMDKIKYKSKMKEYFQKAGVKVARFILVSSYEESLNFVNNVGYPVFAKPDNGVGANQTYKIKNEDDLRNFHQYYPKDVTYIMEEFIEGELISYDGICNLESDVKVAFYETFPTPIAEIVQNDSDVYYYAALKMPKQHRINGENVVKSFGISKRCFHIEFFRLTKDKEGLGKKGDYIGLEVNMRCPGGNTPNMLSVALDASFYEAYADIITTNTTPIKVVKDNKITIAVSRKERFWYKHSEEEIWNKYGSYIKESGWYDDAFVRAMGRRYFYAKFPNLKMAKEFQQFVHDKF